MSYAEHRAQRLSLAEGYDGPNMPPYPFLGDGRMLGRVLILPKHWRGQKIVGFVGKDPLLETEFRAREKRQNREHFK